MISDEARAALAVMRADDSPAPPDLKSSRLNWEAKAALEPLPPGTSVAAIVIGGVAAEWVRTGAAESRGTFLLLHGGGYVSGSPATHRKLAAWIARESGMEVIVPAYRLAPEHPFPAGLEDALAVWIELTSKTGVHAAVVGDSAGGGLALALLLTARARRLPLPSAAVLMSPWADLRGVAAGQFMNAATDPVITRLGLAEAATYYAGGADPADPRISPVMARLESLPPLLIDAGGEEILLDDAAVLAAHGQADGVAVNFRVWPGFWHVWHHHAGTVPEADAALARIGAFLRSHTG